MRCPVCANGTLAEFYEPAGTTICPRCGFVVLRDSLGRIAAEQAERPAELDVLRDRLQILRDEGADSLDFLQLAMDLEKAGITIEDLKARNVQTLEDLERYIELIEAINGQVPDVEEHDE
jgi:acyl carrier protein